MKKYEFGNKVSIVTTSKRGLVIGAKIGHMKNDSRMDRNYLLGKEGDKINAMLCAAAMNIRFLLAAIYAAIRFELCKKCSQAPAFYRGACHNSVLLWPKGLSQPRREKIFRH